MIRRFLPVIFVIGMVILFSGKAGSAKNITAALQAACDAGLAINTNDPVDAARAIDICKMAAGPNDWGLVSAAWVMADGSAAVNNANYAVGHGILPAFGANVAVRNGERMLALSSGTARRPIDPGYQPPAGGLDKGYTGSFPTGFPNSITTCLGACPPTSSPHDDAALAVTLRVPWFANGFSFDFKFYTSNFPAFVCSAYDDIFIAILSPFPEGSSDGNIAFDPGGQVVRISESLLQYCTPNVGVGCYTCPQGTSQLQGTGYENYAGSSWLTASAPATPGAEITLRFAIFDSGDGAFDSTVLIDNFQWSEAPKLWLPLIVKP